MHQVKFFKGIETELTPLQEQVNEWLRENNAKVVNMFGNIAPQTTRSGTEGSRQFLPSDIFVAVVYEQG